VVRAGSPAVLLIEGDHIHIQIQVVCLENGAPGQTIRASSKDHRQTYTAKVGEDAVLRGKL
jgi:flagella basal body P-ring formation protein FlgA